MWMWNIFFMNGTKQYGKFNIEHRWIEYGIWCNTERYDTGRIIMKFFPRPHITGGWLRPYKNPKADCMPLSTVSWCWSFVLYYIFVWFWRNSIFHLPLIVLLYYWGPSRAYLKEFICLLKTFLVISESIYYFVFRLYAWAFLRFIVSFFNYYLIIFSSI